MIIQIVDINLNRKKLISHLGTKLIHGYWMRFKHSDFEGTAYFVPSNMESEEIIFNKDYSVETSHEKTLTYFKTENTTPNIEYNSKDESYYLRGKMSFISDDNEIVVLNIWDIDFTFDSDEIDIKELEINDEIEIEIKDLTLWDEGIF
ncbi:hypothetical protein SAMN04488542_101316 [Fontibacillus panacisegetis]|uniref:Uncharacterized protein n=1 Tax=Fontibacillus panacisegetis TaxID=670482 RepID=A0A1G7ES39_9BACL|nr:hypothetical protein [Fontibacillus panacisegetis]SDE66463.1 hypothetical protein SAMN04488542_101316 [Fontibacillus panacisegetis]